MQAFDIQALNKQVSNIQVHVEKQGHGLWRANVPGLGGCFVDAPTVEQAITDIQAVAAMFLDLLEKNGEQMPPSVAAASRLKLKATIPAAIGEHPFARPAHPSAKPVLR